MKESKPFSKSFLLLSLMSLFFTTTASAGVFETENPECYWVTQVRGGNIYVKEDPSGTLPDQILSLDPMDARLNQILEKARESVSLEQMLCGSTKGFSFINRVYNRDPRD